MSLKNVCYFVAFAMIVVACSKEPVELVESKVYGDELVLGERLANPYSITNMNLASSELGRSEIKANKKYVRFLIEKEEEMTLLKSRISLLFDHPLDYKIKERGAFYKNENLDNKAKYYYTVLDEDFKLSSELRYEVLEELYVPKNVDIRLERQAFERLGLTYENSSVRSTSGNISFEEINEGNVVPIKNLKVIAREWFRFEVIRTDALGNFTLTKSYNSTAEIFIQFDNDLFEFRTLSEDNILLLLLPNLYILGNYGVNESMNILLNESNFNNSNLLMTASAYSSYYDFLEFAEVYDMEVPTDKLLVWMAEDAGVLSTGNAAPMLRSLASDDLQNIRTLLKELLNFPDFLANPISNILKNDIPDLFLLYDERFPTKKESTWYHEYAHASHYAQAGAELWLPYIEHIFNNGGYGGPGEQTSGIIALSEAWAEDASQWCHEWKFGYAQDNLEDLGPNDFDWIPYGLYYDLFDDNNSADENDNVSGLTINELYAELQSDVNSPELLKSSILSAIDDAELIDAINNLFADYGY